MQTDENSLIEARPLYHKTSLHSAFICSKMQVYVAMVECKN